MPPPGSAFITAVTNTSDDQGFATWSGYVHADGQQVIEASTPGLPSTFFTLGVTPSPHPYDGYYNCTENGALFSSSQLGDFVIENGTVQDRPSGDLYEFYSHSLNEADGQIELIQRSSLDFENSYDGVLVIHSDQSADGGGEITLLYHLGPDPASTGPWGSWFCIRE